MQSAPAILFIENREKTRFWEAIARELLGRGARIGWLVQNPQFTPRSAGTVFQLGFPRSCDLAEADEGMLLGILRTDRGRQHFGAGSAHYGYYRGRILSIMRSFAPVVVIGESTLLHELLALEAAERVGAAFWHPAAGRYPFERFFLYRGATQLPFGGSGDPGDPKEAIVRARQISEGREILPYMARARPLRRAQQTAKWAITRSRVMASRLAGERYNTPSLVRKIGLWLRTRRNAARWDRIARIPDVRSRTILYPLQLQPESSIDVWGRPFHDQPKLIGDLLAAAPSDVHIAVKANPKLKYETSDELLALAEGDPRILLLPRSTTMAEAQAKTVGAVTVCGTVGLEAVFGKGRCLSLRHPVISEHFPEFAAADPPSAVFKLLGNPQSGCGDPDKGAQLLQILSRDSYPGIVSDPLSMRSCVEPANVQLVTNGIEHALELLASRERT